MLYLLFCLLTGCCQHDPEMCPDLEDMQIDEQLEIEVLKESDFEFNINVLNKEDMAVDMTPKEKGC